MSPNNFNEDFILDEKLSETVHFWVQRTDMKQFVSFLINVFCWSVKQKWIILYFWVNVTYVIVCTAYYLCFIMEFMHVSLVKLYSSQKFRWTENRIKEHFFYSKPQQNTTVRCQKNKHEKTKDAAITKGWEYLAYLFNKWNAFTYCINWIPGTVFLFFFSYYFIHKLHSAGWHRKVAELQRSLGWRGNKCANALQNLGKILRKRLRCSAWTTQSSFPHYNRKYWYTATGRKESCFSIWLALMLMRALPLLLTPEVSGWSFPSHSTAFWHPGPDGGAS